MERFGVGQSFQNLKGTVRVAETLNLCAEAIAEAGGLGIFTPMYFIHARKPE